MDLRLTARMLQTGWLVILLLTGAPAKAFEFECARQADYLPPLDKDADELFMQARRAEVTPGNTDEENISGLYQLAAEKGHWKAMHNLSRRYLDGIGVPTDSGKALDLTEKLIEMNVPIGYYNMAVLLERGRGVHQDREAAWQYLHKAASMGEPNALVRIGQHYGYDLAREDQEDDKAAAYYACAAQQSSAIGYKEYASWLKIVDKNYPKAAYYYLLAAGNGNYRAAVFISGVFLYGDLGYEKDEEYGLKLEGFLRKLDKDPLYKLPNIAERYPLPYHPTLGRYNPETDQNEMPEK
ncbi:tetratricopeptide repeat protein [uncultured Amphritea sp.]|uniref:tetratricopeptide repeat protein n=1 Tax=uncultured Amphritea sp. TaxID=981605 RepID=UPI0026217EE3|nr:tetratricopeptide repeat protein [uncultured Amphritea sp.]